MSKIKILGLSDSIKIATGYANQTRELFIRLANNPDFDVTLLAWQDRNMTMPNTDGEYYNPKTKKYSTEPFEGAIRLLQDFAWWPPQSGVPENPDARFGTGALKQYLKREQPDILWVLGDSFFFGPQSANNHVFSNFYQLDFAPAKSVFWFPSDGELLPNNSEAVFRKFDKLVSISKFGQDQIIRGAKPLSKGLDCDFIPHGSDSTKFYPFNDIQKVQNRTKWAQKLSPVNGRVIDFTNKFICGIVARNQPRKDLVRLLQIWKEFTKDKPDTILLMHTDPIDPSGPQLLPIIQYFEIPNIVFTGMNVGQGQFSEKDLNEVYNLMDVHTLHTSGEGFGVPTIESQFAGVPSVTTNYTTCKELVLDSECGLGVDYDEVIGQCYVMRAVPDKIDFVKKLNLVYSDRNLLKKFAANCRPNALAKYDFEKVVYPAWVKLLKELVE